MSIDFQILASGFAFCEAPRIAENGDVFFSDLVGGGYFRWRQSSGVRCVLPDRRWIGGAVLDTCGGIVVSGEGGLARVDIETGAVRPILSEIGNNPVGSINDIEADATGGLFGGTIDFQSIMVDQTEPAPGTFFHLSPTGELTVLRTDVVMSNGMAFSPDRNRLYHSECTRGVWAYELGDDGLPADQKLIAEFHDCDGLAVDSAGDIWVACWDQGVIYHLGPDGERKGVIDLPFTNLVSLEFGGEDRKDLIICTGGTMKGSEEPAGGIVRIRRDVPGQRGLLTSVGTR